MNECRVNVYAMHTQTDRPGFHLCYMKYPNSITVHPFLPLLSHETVFPRSPFPCNTYTYMYMYVCVYIRTYPSLHVFVLLRSSSFLFSPPRLPETFVFSDQPQLARWDKDISAWRTKGLQGVIVDMGKYNTVHPWLSEALSINVCVWISKFFFFFGQFRIFGYDFKL